MKNTHIDHEKMFVYCRYIVGICTVLLIGACYISWKLVETDSVAKSIKVRNIITKSTFEETLELKQCSKIQDMAQSRLRKTCKDITEIYKQVTTFY